MTTYDHDLYFCFADEDNAAVPGGEGWVDELVTCVHRCLGMSGVPQVRFGTLPNNARLEERSSVILECASVVLVLSPAFLASDWCTDGRLRAALLDMVGERRDRVFVVERSEVERTLAAAFDPLRRFAFWRSDRGAPRTLGFPSVAAEPDKQTYFAAVSDLTRELAGHLKPPPLDKAPDSRGRVFLAEATADVEDRRLEIMRYLEQAGFEVLPRGRLPADPSQFEAEAARLIARCRLFVQVLGANTEHADDFGPVYRQLEIAQRERREILQWRDHALDVAKLQDDRLRALLERETVFVDSIPAFCTAVTTAAAPAGPSEPLATPIVFVDVRRDEVQVLDQLFGRRYPHVRWDWHEPKLTELKRMLRAVDGVVLYWGREAGERTLSRYYIFHRHFKALKKSAKRLLIYDGPPEEKPPFPGAGSWPVAPARDGGEPILFRQFLQEIAQ
jgi:hypothetical protein